MCGVDGPTGVERTESGRTETGMAEHRTRDARRQQILDAAMRCYSRKGYHATTMEDITHESGLTKGGIYWHFSSKWQIFIEMLREHRKVHMALWDRIESIEARHDALIEGGLLFLREHIENRWLAKICSEIAVEATRNEEVRLEYQSMFAEIRWKIHELFETACGEGAIRRLDFPNLTVALIAAVEGILDQYWLSGETLDYESVWRAFCSAFLGGILRREDA